MSAVTLTLREPSRQRIDLSPVLPERLAGLDSRSVAAIELASGNRRLRLGDLFDVALGDGDGLTIRDADGRLDRIGAGMTAGSIAVEGDAGAYAGLAMTGGILRIEGSAGDAAGAAMRGGRIGIAGSAGDLVGGAVPGESAGMRGGSIAVRGRLGERAGDRMRRGIILAEGGAGACLGSRMIAGTIIVADGPIGPWPGFAMRRGTLLLPAAPQQMLPTFADCGRHDLGFLRLLHAALRQIAPRLATDGWLAGPVRRLAGDGAVGGKGEILLAGH